MFSEEVSRKTGREYSASGIGSEVRCIEAFRPFGADLESPRGSQEIPPIPTNHSKHEIHDYPPPWRPLGSLDPGSGSRPEGSLPNIGGHVCGGP